ncbi:MAG: 3-oxoacyl-ACP synthase, partial [Pseudomonadota bacterium]
AEVIGFSCANNGGDLILPNADGVKLTIKMGLENAKISAKEVDFISAHATATRMGDIVEAQAISALYGDSPYVTGLKSYFGHTMGSCGVIETIAILLMMERGVLVPTLNLEEVDDRCNMINHTSKIRELPIRIATLQNFAFGGVNTCLFFKKFE